MTNRELDIFIEKFRCALDLAGPAEVVALYNRVVARRFFNSEYLRSHGFDEQVAAAHDAVFYDCIYSFTGHSLEEAAKIAKESIFKYSDLVMLALHPDVQLFCKTHRRGSV